MTSDTTSDMTSNRTSSESRSTRLQEARREAELRVQMLRASLRREVGVAPGRKGLWMLIAAGAVGLALAVGTAAAVRRGRRDAGKTTKALEARSGTRKAPNGARKTRSRRLTRRRDA